ncbi:MAG: hypothetical protein ABI347_07540 [Nitrososphaera sp.]|jgi:galactokinase
MEASYAIETLEQATEQIFEKYREISYIAVIDGAAKVVVQKGFLELHPAKLDKFHIQTALLVKVCAVSAESFGTLDHVTVSFGSKSNAMVVPISRNFHMAIVLPHSAEISMQIIRHEISACFDSCK